MNLREIIKNFFLLKECKIGDTSSAIYLINTETDDGLILIDAGFEFNFKKEMKKIDLNPEDIKHCLLTHGHFDHVEGCKELIKFNPMMRFHAHVKDKNVIESLLNKESNLGIKINEPFTENFSILKFDSYEFRCFHIPGHLPGGMAFLTTIKNHDVLFSGDICGGGLDSNGGNYEEFKNSLQKLLHLKVDILCEGHLNIIQPSEIISKYIKGFQRINEYLHIGFDLEPKNSTNWYNFALQSFQLKIYDNAYDACNYALKLDPTNAQARELFKEIKKFNPPKLDVIEKNLKRIYGENY